MKKILLVSFLIALVFSTNSYALEDTVQNREIQAWRYLATMNIGKLVNDIFKSMAGDDKALQEKFTDTVPMAEFNETMKVALVEVMTANELEALANFYGSKYGQSATAKSGQLMEAFFRNATPIFEEMMQAENKEM